MAQTFVQLSIRGGNAFEARALAADPGSLSGASIDTVQVNVGLRCNMACHHCHVESSPNRTEEMTWATMSLVLGAAGRVGARVLDVTGGAPEMHPRFRDFVVAARGQHLEVITRTNLTILLEPGYESFPEFFREHGVRLVASLPCYLEANVDKQRGRGTYVESIEAIRRLNRVGYGVDPTLPLDLVFNPGGPSLPPPQASLEADYKRELGTRFGVAFTRLLTIANMPIGRFRHDLARDGHEAAYVGQLTEAFNAATLPGLMCRHQVHVGWDGTLYDCDFNYALAMPAAGRAHVRDFDPDAFLARRIVTADHCFACTAGSGSSCGGALA